MPPLLPRNNRTLLRLSLISTSIAGIGLATALISRSSTTLLPFASSTTTTTISNAMSTTTTTTPPTWPTRAYKPRHTSFPYTASDLTPSDPGSDARFYSSPRYVTHIDDHAISVLREYFSAVLPKQGRILDMCTSWISHYPAGIEEGVKKTAAAGAGGAGAEQQTLEVLGIGMSAAEMRRNPVLAGRYLVHDLNEDPKIPDASSFPSLLPSSPSASSTNTTSPTNQPLNLTTTTCTVSIDYLTSPHLVLSSLLQHTLPHGSVHLIISNRCFPTKAVSRWLRISEEERLQMVGDYLWHAGWRDVEIVELSDGVLRREAGVEGQGQGAGGMGALMKSLGLDFGGNSCDPLWVVRGVKPGEEGSRASGQAASTTSKV